MINDCHNNCVKLNLKKLIDRLTNIQLKKNTNFNFIKYYKLSFAIYFKLNNKFFSNTYVSYLKTN